MPRMAATPETAPVASQPPKRTYIVALVACLRHALIRIFVHVPLSSEPMPSQSRHQSFPQPADRPRTNLSASLTMAISILKQTAVEDHLTQIRGHRRTIRGRYPFS